MKKNNNIMGIDEILEECWFDINSGAFEKSWEIWERDLRSLSRQDITGTQVLSDYIRKIFMKGNKGIRNQSSVSIAGSNWKKMLWTICASLSTSGCTIPLLGKKMIGKVLNKQLLDLITIKIGDRTALKITPDLIIIRFKTRIIDANNLDDLRKIIDNDISIIDSISILWAKTNFNDNIKEYMLWSWIGENQSKEKEPFLNYSWVTVPTNDPTKYAKGNAPLIRAKSMNNGGFWGIGDIPDLEMKSIIELIPDWRENMKRFHEQGKESKFINSAFSKYD